MSRNVEATRPRRSGHMPRVAIVSDKREDNVPDSTADSSTVTAGDVLADGTMIELVRDGTTGELSLLTWNCGKVKVAPRVRYKGRVYAPPAIDASLARAIRLPTQAECYGTTRKLFTNIVNAFERYGIADQTARRLAYFTFASWFPDCALIAPLLVLFGAETDATRVLRLLACLCRRPLLLGDLSVAALCSLPARLYPTLLVSQPELSASTRKLLRATSSRDTYVLRGRQLVSPFCAKAVFAGEHPGNRSLGDSAIQLAVTPTSRSLPLLDVPAEEEIAEDFQPKLLFYRLANHNKVRSSNFEVAALTSPVAALARTLGACVVGDRELQSGLEVLLRQQDERVRVRHATGLKAVVLEALLVLCHEDKESAYVNEITKLANGILLGRGEALELNPRAVGALLDSLGLHDRPRNGGGYRILLLQETRRVTHELARAYGVPTRTDSKRCIYCVPAGRTN